MKRVAIVGAGPCGLVALKEMIEQGHEAVLHERSGKLGGIFATAAAYPNLHLTISNWAMAFSDFPDPTRLRYSTAGEYLQYLQHYACHFGLDRHIRYYSEVCDATLSEEGLWSLRIRQSNDAEECITADGLIVATGANQLPNPIPSGLVGFDGRVTHSSEYDGVFKKEVEQNNLKVLVVGGGESGADIAAELGDLSPNVTVWLRRPICVGPRYLNDKVEMEQILENKTTDFPANGFLEAATTNRMSVAQNVYTYGFFRRILWHALVLNGTLARMCLASCKSAFFRNDQATYVTKNQHGTTKQLEFDAVVLCTGFLAGFPWIHLPDNTHLSSNPRSWFPHCFPPGFGHCLFFVGYARPHQGGVPVMAEMLSRYIALLLCGRRFLPVDYPVQARHDEQAEREYYSLSPHLHTLVDYNAFLESVARRIGCEPSLPLACLVLFNIHMFSVLLLVIKGFKFSSGLVLGDSRYNLSLWAGSTLGFFLLHDGLLFKWWFYPQWATWYRQRGPGARPELLKTMMRRVNLWKSTAITRGFVMLVLWSIPTFYAQRLLSIFLFAAHAMLVAAEIRVSPYWGGMLRPKLFSLHSCPWKISDLFLP
ncbi:hypothetical protein LTR10_021281 [Elasticomyces elasticus]|uniref:FAD/NAD(P)-binding domain-containing protein n=1 Tax=Exophiala sideris TaxID=1016849 RepID=A0ABR0JHB4_9EURO|nr:hypothetical protein LTR10_021281 [Elasticomyces elasticus]KAK5025333.1 hypothetical protein LTS07_008184 [Exophiala sideris]KAK5063393.1 hypothetical protein LTR69_004099 [Exophiala sideris]KAK5179108.1 hypothetical protein LTR44_008597 [Eurotiomycetes sp. CCFEE 6388]